MLEFNTKLKRWGNSFGLIIPRSEIEKDNLKPEEELYVIAIKKNDSIKNSFGLLKGWKVSGQKAKEIIRKELHNG